MPKVIFLNLSGRLLEVNSEIKSVCILPISVGQPYHEGSAFEAVVRAANAANFTKIVIVVADTLQRYTLQLKGMSEEDAFRVSDEKGKAWVKGVLKYLPNLETPVERLGISEVSLPEDATTYPPPVTLRLPCKIVYWNELLTDPGFTAEKVFVNETYEESKQGTVGTLRDAALVGKKKAQTFFTTIEDVGYGFLRAYLSAHENDLGFNSEEAEAREQTGHFFLNYVLEELAATMLYGKLDPIRKKYIAYPHIVKACEAITELFTDLFHDGSLRFINIHFSGIDFGLAPASQKRKSTKPKPLKSPLEIQVTPPADDATKAKDAPEGQGVEHYDEGVTEEGEEKSVRPRSVQMLLNGKPLKLDGSSRKIGVCPISDTPYFKGEAFAAIIEAINKSDFEEIVIVVRGKSSYTLQLDGTSEEDAKRLARKSELEWLESVAKYLPDLTAHVRLNPDERLNISVLDTPFLVQLTKPYKVKLWEEVLENPCFAEAKVKLEARYKAEESLFTSSISLSADREFKSALSQRLEFYKTIYGAANSVYSKHLRERMPTLTIAQIQQAERNGCDLCVRHLIAERSADFVLIEYGVYFLYSFNYGTDSVKRMPELIRRVLKEEGGKDVIPVNLDLVDFPEILGRKKVSKSPLAIQVIPPVGDAVAKAEGEPREPESKASGSRPPIVPRTRSRRAVSESDKPEAVPLSKLFDIPRRRSPASDSGLSEERRESPEEFGKMLGLRLSDPKHGMEYFSELLKAAAKFSSVLTRPIPPAIPPAKPSVLIDVSPPEESHGDLSGPLLRKAKSASFFRYAGGLSQNEETGAKPSSIVQKVG